MEETVYYGEVPDDRVILKCRKVLSYDDKSKGLRFYRRKPVYVRWVELDEQTGRVLIAADYPEEI